jgi:hypothetical protein
MDLKTYVDSKPGPGIGVHVAFDLGDGHMWRPRLDYVAFPEASFASLHQTAKSFSAGADYLYFLSGKPEGFYLTVGASGTHWSFGTKVGSAESTSSTTKPGVAAGAGYQWSALVGTEARVVHSRIASGFQATMLQLGVTVHF